MKNIHALIGVLFLSFTGLYLVIKSEPSSFAAIVCLFFTQSFLLFLFFKTSKKTLSYNFWIIAIIANIIVAFSEPIFEDDYWRYLWDGKMIAAGVNPYVYAPDDKALDSLHTEYREKINYLHIKTIYPPVAQYVFFINVKIFGESLLGLKFIFIFFHFLTGLIVYKWLLLRGMHPKWLLLYLLHPMPLKEIANSAHVDSVMVFFLVLAAYLIDAGFKKKVSELAAWFALALSALTKVIPLILVPSFFIKSKKPIQGLFVFTVTLVLLSAPFLSAGKDFVSGLVPFSKYWVTNESLFYPISYFANKLLLALNLSQSPEYFSFIDKEYPARLIVAFIFITIVAYRFFLGLRTKSVDIAHECLWVIASLLLLAPTFNPWYSLWFLPFAVIKKNIPFIILPGLTVFSYAWYWDKSLILRFQLLEYGLFFAILFYFNFWKTKRT